MLKVVCWAGSVPFPPVSLQRQVVCLLLLVFLSGESVQVVIFLWFVVLWFLIDVNYVYVTMFTTSLDFGSWTGVISALDCCLVSADLCVRMLSLYATGWPLFQKCMQLTLVRWCHCWMFSWSDALPMQSYPSNKVWVLCQCGITYLFKFPTDLFLHEIGGIL